MKHFVKTTLHGLKWLFIMLTTIGLFFLFLIFPALLVDYFNNNAFSLFYIPHLIIILYIIGDEFKND